MTGEITQTLPLPAMKEKSAEAGSASQAVHAGTGTQSCDSKWDTHRGSLGGKGGPTHTGAPWGGLGTVGNASTALSPSVPLQLHAQ